MRKEQLIKLNKRFEKMQNQFLIKIHSVRFILILASFIFQVGVSGQDSLSLYSAIQKGLENNFQVRIFEEYTEIAKLNNAWGTVGRYPSVSLGVTSVNRYDDSPSVVEVDGRSQAYLNGITPYINVNWLLFNGFAVKMNKDKLKLLEELSMGNSTLIVENTLQAIILSYYKALLEQEKLDVLSQVKKLSGDRFKYERIRQELGSAVTFEVLQAKNSYYSDSTNFLLQELNVKNAFLNLNLLLGEPPEISFFLTDSFYVDTPVYEYDDLVGKMKYNNKTLLNQYVNQEVLKKDIGIQKSGLYPVISMNAGADINETRLKYVDTDAVNSSSLDYYANFTLSFNLFNGGNTRRSIEQARISEQIGTLETLELEQTLSNLLANQYDLYNIRKQLYDVAMVNIESAALNMEISTEKYRNGSINSFNFRDVQLIYLNASFRKLEAVYNLISTHTELLRLTGGIVTEY